MTIYIKIFAGLCNRLFQYSYGRHLISQGHKVKFIVADDGNTDILDIFDTGNDEKLFYTNSKNGKLFVNLLKAFSKYITQNYKIGFFQEPEFASCINLSFKNISLYLGDSITKKIDSENAVSLHIRGGDYLDPSKANSFINVCTKDYYQAAINEIQKQVSSPIFYIFTNDRNYASSILKECKLKPGSFFFADDIKEKNYDDGFDLFLMSRCKANIIANSTFSWWGAFLNKETHLVICPKHWTNTLPYTHDNLILPNWSRI